ncbi:hypothetical protein DX130_20175 [Paenibacillus paeoniae]|uniref:Uncharacterized protein n=1 Tax=Paenibacillus paeoniae TaxID=2292705 RepID=A0A371P7W0_9BACL|nr:hypothetical protein DX130_20175 [Paenibacillus paeoniae]
MLKTKITICALLSLTLIGISAFTHQHVQEERSHHFMHPPIPEGSYQMYDQFEPGQGRAAYTPYSPREYVRIVKRAVRP